MITLSLLIVVLEFMSMAKFALMLGVVALVAIGFTVSSQSARSAGPCNSSAQNCP